MPTPRTDQQTEDSALEDKNHPHTDWVPAYFARKLELELQSMTRVAESWQKLAMEYSQQNAELRNKTGEVKVDPPLEVTPYKLRAADVVIHIPTDVKWTLACDQDGENVFPCGWSETMAKASECKLVQKATEYERRKMLKNWDQPFSPGCARTQLARQQRNEEIREAEKYRKR
jgi:hypothetical protein